MDWIKICAIALAIMVGLLLLGVCAAMIVVIIKMIIFLFSWNVTG